MNEERSARAVIEYEIEDEDIGQRLDLVLTQRLSELLQSVGCGDIAASRSRLKRWISEGMVSLDGTKVTKSGVKIKTTDSEIKIFISQAEVINLTPDSSVAFDIVYEDDQLLVIDKPADLVIHPAPGNYHKTLVHGLLAHLGPTIEQVGDRLRPGIVHRLDKGTSGLLVVAKTDLAFQHLRKQFQPPRTISRTYLAVTFRLPDKNSSGVIDKPIGRDSKNRKKMSVVEDGRAAVTKYELIEELYTGCLLRCQLETGRTHQIRVHLAACNAPIIGDPLYGVNEGGIPSNLRSAVNKIGRQALHASRLSFLHPSSNEEMNFDSPTPQDIKELIDVLNQ